MPQLFSKGHSTHTDCFEGGGGGGGGGMGIISEKADQNTERIAARQLP